MAIRKYTPGQSLTAERLNELVMAALENIVGGDGIQIDRAGRKLTIKLAKRDRGIWTARAADLSGFEVGDMVVKYRTDASVIVNGHRWLNCCNPTGAAAMLSVGDASSGATAWASADADDIFAALWARFANTELPIQDSTGAPSVRGASAAADFAAHKRLPLPDWRDRIPVGRGYTKSTTGDNDGFAYDARDMTTAHDHGLSTVLITSGTADNWDNATAPSESGAAVLAYTNALFDNNFDGSTGSAVDYNYGITDTGHTHDVGTDALGHDHEVDASAHGTDDTEIPHIVASWYILAEIA